MFAFAIAACTTNDDSATGPVKVEVVKLDSGYQLMRDGEPYHTKGAGLEYGDIVSFVAHGGNSIRNWTTTNDVETAQEVLDKALANGVTVTLCLPMGAEHWGFDYDDPGAVAAQLKQLRGEVLKYRDHPALLAWIIGNELNFDYSNSKVYDAVNDVSKMIHELDPNHPTTTTMAGLDAKVVDDVSARAPDLDFVSFQVYGQLAVLRQFIEETGYDKPFFVTEWGAIGHWEMPKTAWGAPIELTSSEKANVYSNGYRENLETLEGQLICSYVFLLGQKQERTPTWFGLFTEAGEETETVDVMHHIWNGTWPDNRSPRLKSIQLDHKSVHSNTTLVAGKSYQAAVDVSDPDGDSLSYRWELKPESDAAQVGGVFEESIRNLAGLIDDASAANIRITATEPGAYRLFVYTYDGQGHAAHANFPFLVDGENTEGAVKQAPDDLLAGEVMAVAYSGFRVGQHPDRGDGAVNPSTKEILEDLEILVAHNFNLIRLYDSSENSSATLGLIRRHNLPIKVLLGMWLRAEFSNHDRCPWLHEPIPEADLAANALENAVELQRGIELARQFDDIVIAVNVGNEALVEWNDHMVPLENVIAYVRRVKAAIDQPVTVADNYLWWIRDGAPLAAEVDFLGVHTYPAWEGKTIDEALAYTVQNIEGVHAALPDKSIAILEAGWASVATEFGDRASETSQARHYGELRKWASATKTTVFFFEAFDEPWKGDPNNPLGAEKHWGLFNVDRTPKQVLKQLPAAGDT